MKQKQEQEHQIKRQGVTLERSEQKIWHRDDSNKRVMTMSTCTLFSEGARMQRRTRKVTPYRNINNSNNKQRNEQSAIHFFYEKLMKQNRTSVKNKKIMNSFLAFVEPFN